MDNDIFTARLLLRPIKTNEESSIDLERFHALWSNEQATKWSQRGSCKTLEESKAWMAGIIPIPMPTNKIRVSYCVLCAKDAEGAEGAEGLIHPAEIAEKHWTMAGVVTLLATNFKLADEIDDCIRGPDDPYKAVELGYLFMPEIWGKGFATESVRAVLGAYREMEPANPLFPRDIQASAHADNAGSRRVLEKTGFNEVGRFECEACLPLVNGAQSYTVVHFRHSLREWE